MSASPYPTGSPEEIAYLEWWPLHGVGFDVDADGFYRPEVSQPGPLKSPSSESNISKKAWLLAVAAGQREDSITDLAQWVVWTRRISRVERLAQGLDWVEDFLSIANGLPTIADQGAQRDRELEQSARELDLIKRRVIDAQLGIWLSNSATFAGHDASEDISHLIPGWTTAWGGFTIADLEAYSGAPLPGRERSTGGTVARESGEAVEVALGDLPGGGSFEPHKHDRPGVGDPTSPDYVGPAVEFDDGSRVDNGGAPPASSSSRTWIVAAAVVLGVLVLMSIED